MRSRAKPWFRDAQVRYAAEVEAWEATQPARVHDERAPRESGDAILARMWNRHMDRVWEHHMETLRRLL